MPSALDTFVQQFKSTGRLEAPDTSMLVWTTPTDNAVESTQEYTRPSPPGAARASPTGRAVVFPVVRRSTAPGPIVLGRSSECDVQLLDDTVSRKHVDLSSTRHGWSVVDRGSKNGTWVGQTQLLANTPLSLTDGARLQIGSVELIFMSPTSFAEYVAQLAKR